MLASKIGLASNTVAPTGACSAPPHLLSGRGRLPLVQWLPISHRPTCSVDAGVCHLLSGTKSRTAPLAQWTQASATCSVAPNLAPPHLLSGRRRLPLAQWHQIRTSPTCSVPRCLLIQPVQLLLWQQGAELQLVLVAQPPAAEELHVHPHGCADEPQLLRAP